MVSGLRRRCREEVRMITYKSEIPVKEYNAMREAVGWKVLEEEQAQTGLDNSAYLTAAWDGDKPVGMA